MSAILHKFRYYERGAILVKISSTLKGKGLSLQAEPPI